MGIPWLKKFWSFCTLGRHGWRKNFPAAEGGRQIFWVVPWEFDPQMIFFACPCMTQCHHDSKIFFFQNLYNVNPYHTWAG